MKDDELVEFVEIRTTRREVTGVRDLKFSQWIRTNLPASSTCTMVSDLDWCIYNYKTKRMFLMEAKTHSAQPKKWQQIMYENLVKWIKKGIDPDWKFYGIHYIVFENTCFDDGKMWHNGKEESEQDFRDWCQFLLLSA